MRCPRQQPRISDASFLHVGNASTRGSGSHGL